MPKAKGRSLLGFFTTCSLAVLTSVSVGAHDYDGHVTKWVALPERFALPTTETFERWYQAGLLKLEWWVYLDGGQVRAALSSDIRDVQKPPAFSPRVGDYQFTNLDTYLRTDDGWLISFRRGEWGGALYWFSPDGGTNRYIGGSQVNQFLRVHDHILAAEGLSHLGTSNGSLIELSRSTDTKEWHYKTVKRLPQTPYVFAPLNDGGLLIVLLSSVVSLAPDGKLSTIMTLNYWAGENANSLALLPNGEKAYLGGRNYVAELNFRERRVRYLVPEEILQRLMSPGAGRTPE
jgi:hypothetical protein